LGHAHKAAGFSPGVKTRHAEWRPSVVSVGKRRPREIAIDVFLSFIKKTSDVDGGGYAGVGQIAVSLPFSSKSTVKPHDFALKGATAAESSTTEAGIPGGSCLGIEPSLTLFA